MAPSFGYRVGADENGLGARLGPLIVTAVLARVTEGGSRALARRPGKRLRADLGDSKALVAHGDVALAEAWARALTTGSPDSPAELFAALSHEGLERLRAPCPAHVESQCWATHADRFTAEAAAVDRLRGHLARWRARGIEIVRVKSSVVCTQRLNLARAAGRNRFVADLHAMEELVLGLRSVAGKDVLAICGKIGGMDDYSRFFGPLSHRLHSVLACGKALSAYHFPGVGEVRFVRDADAKDPLVMLASLVGKYVRELLMARVSGFYPVDGERASVSGYHDPATDRFVRATALLRRERDVPEHCFERARGEE